MTLTQKQQEGLEIAVARYKAKEKYTCIAGYAGSGKSTLVRFIISALGLPDSCISYVAYTGKAAQVLRNKGCPNAITAHKLLYYAKQNKWGKFYFSPRYQFENPLLKVVIVDEVSMLPKKMWDLLLSHRNIYVLALGDPFQLPPIDKDENNHVLDNPHIFLDEVMRQALDSEIIRTSMWIREGKPLRLYPCEQKETMIVDDVNDGMLTWADQILCATNRTRIKINERMRQLLGYGEEPQVGDKVIGLRNQWYFMSVNGNALTNGCIGTITECHKDYLSVPSYICKEPIPILYTTIKTEDGDTFVDIPIDYHCLKTGEKFLSPEQEYKMRKDDYQPDPPYEFAYGYAITTHKAQGSEWGKVLVLEEWFPNEPEEHARWLYTAGTRAENRLVVVKK